MTRLTTAAVGLTALALAGCGSSPSTSTTTATSAAPTVAAVNPCALVTGHDVATALGGAPPPVKTPVSCTYATGNRGVLVRVVPETAANRQALDRLIAHPVLPASVVRADVARLYVTPIASVGVKPTAQAQASGLRNGTFVTVVLTDPGLSRRELVARTAALGRAAIGRL
jgi:hypothetical protein